MIHQLPTSLEGRYALALKQVSAPQKVRLLTFIYENPDRYTHDIAAQCAVGYPPCRLWEMNREVLFSLGLQFKCHKPKKLLVNRFGQESLVHRWRLEKLPVGNQCPEIEKADQSPQTNQPLNSLSQMPSEQML